MRRTWAVCKREFVSYFITPIGYVVVTVFAAISGLAFAAALVYYARISKAPATFGYQGVPDLEETMLSPYLVFCGQLVLFIGPLITMRLLAEEKHRGTAELLQTYPLRDRDIIFGKYGAAMGMILVLMAVMGVQLGIVGHFTSVEPAVLVFGLATVFLMSMAFMSLGLFISAITANQVTAGAMTLGSWFVLYILGSLGEDLPEELPVPETWPEAAHNAITRCYDLFRELVGQLPLDAHAKDMAQGIVQPEDIAYYVLFAAFFLFLTFRAFETRKWRA
jgi:ABC-2 type transport system permease protein